MIVHPSVRLCAFYSFTLGRHFNSIKILLGYYVATFKPNRIWHQHHGHDHRHNQDHQDPNDHHDIILQANRPPPSPPWETSERAGEGEGEAQERAEAWGQSHIIFIIIIMGCTQNPISTLSHIWVFIYGIVFVIIVIIIIIIMIIKSGGVDAQL